MKYLPDQPPKYLRLKLTHVRLLEKALRIRAELLRPTDAHGSKQAMLILRCLPPHAPYEISLLPHEWEIVSQSLRYGGYKPERGSHAAKCHSLYQRLRKHFVFATEGQRRRVAQAKKARLHRIFNAP